ncbi:DUF3892 domain-containing protein [Lactococcus lactis]|uniref:DUF3892 domain-containing protein n=1 Tax=Lactococcus lactis TaxID=1358 RepID=UPI0032190ABB
MATCKITHIRLSDECPSTTEKITHIKLSDGDVETIAQAVRYIDDNHVYYYVNSYGNTTEVETVHPYGRDPYIRTKANSTTTDNLLSLPRF